MTKPTEQKQHVTLASLERILAASNDMQLAEACLTAFRQVVPGEHFSAIILNLRNVQIENYYLNQAWLGGNREFWKIAKTELAAHPLAAHVLSKKQSAVLLRSQLVSDAVWKRTWIYNEIERPMGVEDIASVCQITVSGRLMVLTSGRSSNFSECEVVPMRSFFTLLSALPPFRGKDFNGEARSTMSDRTRPNPLFQLSVREMEVLRWVSDGKRDAEIAVILNISPRTVNHHVQSILRKLGVETRTAAGRYF